jgi:hypothetical protein
MSSPKIIYSTNTKLAYQISKRYYGDEHYVWCAPAFGSINLTGDLNQNPPTSRPLYRYNILQEESQKSDLHSSLIKEQKIGLKNGANFKLKEGVINPVQHDEIIAIVDLAYPIDFKPYIYLEPVPFNENALLVCDSRIK